MTDKGWKKIDPSDRALRQSSPVGMEQGVKQIILRICGFEIFNTRPYHNYETWSDGYNIISRRDGKAMTREEAQAVLAPGHIFHKDEEHVLISSEDLDDACLKLKVLLRGKESEG